MPIYNDQPCYVYWLHLPEHTDFLSQGYIGVSKNLEQRIYNHYNSAKKKSHHNKLLERIINKHNENLVQTILFESDEKSCYLYEEVIRPHKHIGWNINKGGEKPPSNKGSKFTKEHCEKISKSKLGKKRPPVTDQTRQKLSQALTGRQLSSDHKEKVKKARLGTKRSTSTRKKLSDSHKGNIPGNAKTITTELGTFTSIKKAAEAHNLSRFKFEKLFLIKKHIKGKLGSNG